MRELQGRDLCPMYFSVCLVNIRSVSFQEGDDFRLPTNGIVHRIADASRVVSDVLFAVETCFRL